MQQIGHENQNETHLIKFFRKGTNVEKYGNKCEKPENRRDCKIPKQSTDLYIQFTIVTSLTPASKILENCAGLNHGPKHIQITNKPLLQ